MKINWQLELAILKAALPIWEEFVFSDEIYWPLHLDHSLSVKSEEKPRLSAGRLCQSLTILKVVMAHDIGLKSEIQPDYEIFQQLISRWPANWEKKIETEMPVRLRQITTDLNDLRKNENPYSALLERVVDLRFMLACMLAQLDVDEGQPYQANLTTIDALLRTLTQPAPFVWQPEFAPHFDSLIYWYLYRGLK